MKKARAENFITRFARVYNDFAPEAELREMKGTWAAFDEYKKHPEL